MLNKMSALIRKEEGATAVEYALIVGVLAILIVGAFTILGGSFETAFDYVSTQISGG